MEDFMEAIKDVNTGNVTIKKLSDDEIFEIMQMRELIERADQITSDIEDELK